MKIFVTGAGGFVGKAVVEALLERGCEVVGLYRRPPVTSPACVVQIGDLDHSEELLSILRRVGPDAIVHLAWYVEHGLFWTAPQNLDCVGMTLRLARMAAEIGCRRFIGVGTCFEYDFPAHGGCHEIATPTSPATLYGISKDSCRRCLDAYFATTATQFSWARLFYLYGQGEHPERLVPSIAARLIAGEPAPVTSGRAVRDFIDLHDAAGALAALTVSNLTGSVNIGTGAGVPITEIARLLGKIAGRPDLIRMGAIPDREGDPAHIVADVRRLTQEVGFIPRRSIEEGLTAAYRSLRDREEV